ncbi:MAG: amidophosphoribosyltransferase [Ignavibacteriales bacterium]|nr:amidophosphoribosyltransferase [Ignavibacteriales bacterium]
MNDKPQCHCGVFGIFGIEDPALFTYYGLHALQHRGQEASGIITASKSDSGKTKFNIHKGIGLVSEVFSNAEVFEKKLPGFSSIGHNRYSTTGASDSEKNIQPFTVNYRMGNLAIAHNGQLTNADIIRKELIDDGAIFQTTSDTEVILHLIARCKLENQVDQILEALRKVEGAYSILILTDDKLIAARDPNGFRPLAIGKIHDSFVVASETCAFDINRIDYLRDVEPGELIVIDSDTKNIEDLKSHKINLTETEKKHCVFEFIYFSRPDSRIFGTNVDKIRRKLGKVLASHHPVYPDKPDEKVIVISVPDSSNTVAMGYQQQLEKMDINSKHEIGLIRSHYIGRTFITPGQGNREIGVRIKFNTVKGVLEDKKVVLIDDSIVRGTTSRQLVKLIREAGARSIHIRISSPPILHPCYYGMDFPSEEELIANRFKGDITKIEEYLGVESLEFMTQDQMLEAMVDHTPDNFCTACFSGNYPVKVNTNFEKSLYEV